MPIFQTAFLLAAGQEGGNGQMPEIAGNGNPYLVKRRTLCNLSLFFQLFKGGLLESKSAVAENRHRGIK
ncbi:hypothetical protein NGDG_00852, partial [Neisseria gonorrhoeae FA6140]